MATFGRFDWPKTNTNGAGAPSSRSWADYTYSRVSNSTVRVNITVTYQYYGTGGTCGSGAGSEIWITVATGGVSQKLTLKSSSESWTLKQNQTKTVSTTLDVPSSTAGSSISVSYTVSNGGSWWVTFARGSQSTSFSAPALLYTACSAPTSVTANKSVATSGSTVTISWSGASGGTNNAITGYDVQWSTGSGWQTLGSYTGTSATKTFYDADMGKTCYFQVRTKGSAGSSYYSGWTGAKAPVLINTPPTVSSLGCNKLLIKTTGETVRFSWNGSDSNGHSLSYYYVLDTSSSTNPTTSSSKTTNKYVDLASGAKATRYFHVRAWDGYEYSSTLHLLLPYNTLPTTPTVDIDWAANKVVDATTFDFSSTDANGQTITYYIYREVSSSSSFTGSDELLSTTTSGSYTDSLSPYSTYAGKYVRYRVRAYDGLEFGSYSSYTVAARKNINPNPPTVVSVNPSIFESSVVINWQTPSVTTSSLQNLYIEKSVSSTQTFSSWSPVAIITAETAASQTYTDSSNLPSRGYYVKYKIRYSDALGYYSSYEESVAIKRNTAPTLDGVITLDFSGVYYPWQKNSMNISWNAAVSDDDSGGQAKKYSLLLNIPGFSQKTIFDKAELAIVSGIISEQLNFVSNDALTSLITSIITTSSRRNEYYSNCYFTIIAYDSFGIASSSVTKYFNMDFRDAPVLSNQSNGIGQSAYYYFTNNTLGLIAENNSDKTGTQILYNQTVNNYPMINAGEQLIITWPKGLDKNNGTVAEDDIIEYTIKRIWSESSGSISDTHEESSYSTLVTLKTSDLVLDSNGKYNYIYTVPAISTNRVVKLGIVATDTTQKKSNFVKFPYGIELCRTVDPSLQLENVKFGDSTSETLKKITSIVTITDIGGSSIGAGRTGISYANRRNLERVLAGRMIRMELQYSENINFDNFQTLLLYLNTNSSYEYNMSNKELSTSTGIDFKKTYFIRILFIVNNAPSQNKESYSNILMLRGTEPPYSFRKMGLGVNNASPDGRLHVKAIESDEDKERVIFGDSDSAGTQRFIIGLLNGKLLAGIIDSGEII